jgi:hypothetical protein
MEKNYPHEPCCMVPGIRAEQSRAEQRGASSFSLVSLNPERILDLMSTIVYGL